MKHDNITPSVVMLLSAINIRTKVFSEFAANCEALWGLRLSQKCFDIGLQQGVCFSSVLFHKKASALSQLTEVFIKFSKHSGHRV